LLEIKCPFKRKPNVHDGRYYRLINQFRFSSNVFLVYIFLHDIGWSEETGVEGGTEEEGRGSVSLR
jgi:hypothetical protein